MQSAAESKRFRMVLPVANFDLKRTGENAWDRVDLEDVLPIDSQLEVIGKEGRRLYWIRLDDRTHGNLAEGPRESSEFTLLKSAADQGLLVIHKNRAWANFVEFNDGQLSLKEWGESTPITNPAAVRKVVALSPRTLILESLLAREEKYKRFWRLQLGNEKEEWSVDGLENWLLLTPVDSNKVAILEPRKGSPNRFTIRTVPGEANEERFGSPQPIDGIWQKSFNGTVTTEILRFPRMVRVVKPSKHDHETDEAAPCRFGENHLIYGYKHVWWVVHPKWPKGISVCFRYKMTSQAYMLPRHQMIARCGNRMRVWKVVQGCAFQEDGPNHVILPHLQDWIYEEGDESWLLAEEPGFQDWLDELFGHKTDWRYVIPQLLKGHMWSTEHEAHAHVLGCILHEGQFEAFKGLFLLLVGSPDQFSVSLVQLMFHLAQDRLQMRFPLLLASFRKDDPKISKMVQLAFERAKKWGSDVDVGRVELDQVDWAGIEDLSLTVEQLTFLKENRIAKQGDHLECFWNGN